MEQMEMATILLAREILTTSPSDEPRSVLLVAHEAI